jgi:hypothetical protein
MLYIFCRDSFFLTKFHEASNNVGYTVRFLTLVILEGADIFFHNISKALESVRRLNHHVKMSRNLARFLKGLG